MAHLRSRERERPLRELLSRDHALNGGILFGLDGYVIEVQARGGENQESSLFREQGFPATLPPEETRGNAHKKGVSQGDAEGAPKSVASRERKLTYYDLEQSSLGYTEVEPNTAIPLCQRVERGQR